MAMKLTDAQKVAAYDKGMEKRKAYNKRRQAALAIYAEKAKAQKIVVSQAEVDAWVAKHKR
jgi:hypothetical protein